MEYMAERTATSTLTATILVAEDQPEVQHALQLLLKTEGHRVELASSPEEALAAIARTDFDLLLLDLNYHRDTTSGAEGLKLLEDLRGLRYDRPVVAMTAWGSIDLAVEAMHHGACDFVQKPWDNDQLIRIVNKHIVSGRENRRSRRRKELEMQDATSVQRRLIPRELPSLPGMSIAGEYRPAAEVGGDYFDVFTMGDKVGICIADVVGKGLPAALMMSNLQAAVKVTAADWLSAADLCRRVNEVMCRNGAADKLITFFYAILDPQTRKLTYCNCGHNAPVVRRGDGTTERLETGGLLLGLSCDQRYVDGEVTMRAGDRLVLFTDGIVEAGTREGDEYGEERLLDAISTTAAINAAGVLAHLIQDVYSHCRGEFEDDVTCVVVVVE